MKSWQNRLLIVVTIAGQALSAVWGGQPVFFSHCDHHEHEAGDDHSEPGCDPATCLAILDHGHEHDEHLAEPGNSHHCHCHHFHVRGEAQRFERGRMGEGVRRHGNLPATLAGATQQDLFGFSRASAPRLPFTAVAPPAQRVLAIESVRLLV